MRKLWQNVQAHKWAALVFLVYWIATLVVVPLTWASGIPTPVVLLLFTVPLVAGILVGWWRSSAHWRDKIGGGMLAGFLCAAITNVVMKGGVIDEVQGYLRGWEHFGQWGEMAVFFVIAGFLGLLLGFAGAVLASIMEHHRNRLISGSS